MDTPTDTQETPPEEFSMIPGAHAEGKEENLFDREYRIERVVDPKSSMGIFSLPRGVVFEGELLREVEIEELDGEDEDILVSDATPYPMRLNHILSRKIRRIGAVTDPSTIKRIAPMMSVLDRATTLICIRRVTHGDIMVGLEVTCPACKVKMKSNPDLSSVTIYRPIDPMELEWDFKLQRASRKAGEDVMARWHVYDGHRELRLSRVTKQIGDKDMLTWRIMGRLMSYGGEKMELSDDHFTNDGKIKQSKELGKMFRVVKLMSQADRNALRNEFRRVEGDLDLTVDTECSNSLCPGEGASFQYMIDISDPNFFFPKEAQSV